MSVGQGIAITGIWIACTAAMFASNKLDPYEVFGAAFIGTLIVTWK